MLACLTDVVSHYEAKAGFELTILSTKITVLNTKYKYYITGQCHRSWFGTGV